MSFPYIILSTLAIILPLVLVCLRLFTKVLKTSQVMYPFGQRIAFYGLNIFLILSIFGLILLETGLWVYDDLFVIIGLCYLLSAFVFLDMKRRKKTKTKSLNLFVWVARGLTVVFVIILFMTIPQITKAFFTNGSGHYEIGYFNQYKAAKTPFTKLTAYRPKFSFEYHKDKTKPQTIFISFSTPSLSQSYALLSTPRFNLSSNIGFEKGVYDLTTYKSKLVLSRSGLLYSSAQVQGKLRIEKVEGNYISGKIKFLALGGRNAHFGDKVKGFLIFNKVKVVEKP